MNGTQRTQHYAEIIAALNSDAGQERVVSALAALPDLRADLDTLERSLIDAARRAGASWGDIAGALGLRSRQAAEQRSLRLHGGDAHVDTARSTRKRQQTIDTQAGTSIIVLRAAAADLATWLDATEHVSPQVRLARTTLDMAAAAPPGALVDLVRLALDDLRDVAVPARLIEAAIANLSVNG